MRVVARVGLAEEAGRQHTGGGVGGGLRAEVTGSCELIALLGYRRIPPGRRVGPPPEARRPRTLPNMAETS